MFPRVKYFRLPPPTPPSFVPMPTRRVVISTLPNLPQWEDQRWRPRNTLNTQLSRSQKICLHLRLISSVLQTEVPFHKDAFLQVKILTEDEKLLHERSIGDGDTKIGKGVLLVELSCYRQTVVLCQWTVWCFLVKGVLKDCFQPLI